MISSTLLRSTKRFALVLALPAAAAAALAIAAINPDAVVVSAFNTALQSPSQLAAIPASKAPVAGTEDFWLKQQGFATPVSVGDTISIGTGQAHRSLEVLEVRAIAPGMTRIDTSTATAAVTQRLLVICKDPALSGPGALVRLMLEPDTGAVHSPQRRQRAL